MTARASQELPVLLGRSRAARRGTSTRAFSCCLRKSVGRCARFYAFMRHTDDIADEPGPVESRRRCVRPGATPSAPGLRGEPVADAWPGWPALADASQRHGIPHVHLAEVLDGVAMDLEPRPFATFDELYDYCYHVASAVGLCCLHVWGYRSGGGRAEALAELRHRVQLTNILRDVAEDARNGRIYLPRDDMARFGVSPDDLTVTHAGEPLRKLLEFEARRLRCV